MLKQMDYFVIHCDQRSIVTVLKRISVKRSKYGVFSGPYFPIFALNTEIYLVNLYIQFLSGKMRTRKSSVLGYFSHGELYNVPCSK